MERKRTKTILVYTAFRHPYAYTTLSAASAAARAAAQPGGGAIARTTARHAAIRPGARSRRCHRAACGSSSVSTSAAHMSRRRGSSAEPLVHAWRTAERRICMQPDIGSDKFAASVSGQIEHAKSCSIPLALHDAR
jgi:hypothetical protein